MPFGPFMNKSVQVKREARTNSGKGVSSAWSVLYSSVKCAITEKDEAILVQGEGIVIRQRVVMYFPGDKAIASGDRIIDGSITYRVLRVYNMGGRGLFQQADLEQLRSGEI